MQEFIRSSPALHTGTALCAVFPCARTAQPWDWQVSALSSSHTTCPRFRACLTMSLSPLSHVLSKRGWRTTGTCTVSSISELPLLDAAGEKSKHLRQHPWHRSLGVILQRQVSAALIPPLMFKGKRHPDLPQLLGQASWWRASVDAGPIAMHKKEWLAPSSHSYSRLSGGNGHGLPSSSSKLALAHAEVPSSYTHRIIES